MNGANPHLPVTFDPAFAQDSPDHALLSPVHPLIRQAAAQLVQTDRAFTALEVSGTGLTLGRFPFAIYCWHHKGIRETLVFQAISVSDQVQERFAEIVAKAVAIHISPEVASRTPTADLDAKHHTMWQKARDDHRTHAARVAAFQRESLKTSQAARMALLREQLAQAQEDRIRRMRQSQIDTAELDYQRHLQDIDLAIARADIISEEVASGIILIQD